MLEIVRGRKWTQAHTFLDSEDGDASDLTVFSEIRAQVRGKVATKNKLGIFEHPLVATAELNKVGNVITATMSRAQTTVLTPGDYIFDMLGINNDGTDESLIDPEPIKVTNRPTYPTGGAVIDDEPVFVIPNFVTTAETALGN